MRVVLDTNVLVSQLLKTSAVPLSWTHLKRIDMITLKELHLDNPLMTAIFRDFERFLPQIDIRPSEINIPDDIEFDELQYFIHSNGFSLSHMLTWCRQLDFALE